MPRARPPLAAAAASIVSWPAARAQPRSTRTAPTSPSGSGRGLCGLGSRYPDDGHGGACPNADRRAEGRAEPGRALRGVRAGAGRAATGRPCAPHARCHDLGRRAPVLRTDRRPHRARSQALSGSTGALPGAARRSRRPRLHDGEVPHARPGCGEPTRSLLGRRARPPDWERGDSARPVAARDAARRGAPAVERPARGHEPRWTSADSTGVLRAALRRDPPVLAAARRQTGG